MASVRARLEEISTDYDESSSIAPYTTFNSLPTEDSLEQIRRNADINGDPAHYQRTDSGVEETSVWAKVFKSRCFKCLDITATVVAISLIWMVMALPTAFYIRTEVKSSHPEVPEVGATSNTTCAMSFYNESNVCTQYLRQYTKCLNSSSTDVFVEGPLNQVSLTKASFLIQQLSFRRVRPQCMTHLEPFVCLYFVHLCYNQTVIRPSKQQCNNIKSVCDTELEAVKKLPIDIDIPTHLSNCAQPSPLDDRDCNVQSVTNHTINNVVNCSEGYYRTTNGTCLPECSVWTPYSRGTVLITDIMALFAAVIAVVFGVADLLLSCVRCQKMYRYPSVFVVYQTIPALILAVLVLVGVSARRKLFCRSQDLQESIQHPTSFCTLTGTVFYYVVMQLLFWWLWHTLAVFWAVGWPFHAKKFNISRNTKYLHIGFVLASLLLPVAPVLIILFISPTPTLQLAGYTVTRSPPFVCAGHNITVNFWAFIFPISLLLAVGITVLVLIMRIVIMKHFLSKIHKIRVNLNWALELKVLIILCYYVLLGAAVLTIFTKALIDLQNFLERFFTLIDCESKGTPLGSAESLCAQQRIDLQKIDNPYPTTVAIVFLGLLPAVNLIYIVKLKELKNKLTCFQTRQVQYIQKESSRSTRYVPYKVQHEPISTTLRHGSLTVHTRNANTEPLASSSRANNDLR